MLSVKDHPKAIIEIIKIQCFVEMISFFGLNSLSHAGGMCYLLVVFPPLLCIVD